MHVDVNDDVKGALARLKPEMALYVGGMGHQDKNFHKDMMIRRGFGEAAERIQELYLAGRKDEAIAAVPDEFVDTKSLVGPPARIKQRYRAWEEMGVTAITVRRQPAAIDVMAEAARLNRGVRAPRAEMSRCMGAGLVPRARASRARGAGPSTSVVHCVRCPKRHCDGGRNPVRRASMCSPSSGLFPKDDRAQDAVRVGDREERYFMSYDAPFAGLKVVDLSQGIAGPYCAMLLAQHGADVIKVEAIGEGDWARTLGTRYGSHTAFSIIGNLGKRAIAVDLKSEAGKQVLWRLLEGADVLHRRASGRASSTGSASTTTPSPSANRACSISRSRASARPGRWPSRPAMDPVLQAYTGLMNENRGEDGIPHRVPVIVVDMSTALYAFQALSAALYARRDEARGRYLDVSLMQAATALQVDPADGLPSRGRHHEARRALPAACSGRPTAGCSPRRPRWQWERSAPPWDAGARDDPRFADAAARLRNDVALLASSARRSRRGPAPIGPSASQAASCTSDLTATPSSSSSRRWRPSN